MPLKPSSKLLSSPWRRERRQSKTMFAARAPDHPEPALGWKIQLNVRNAFGNDDDVPVATNPDGQVAVVRIPNPTVWYLTNSFKF